ncbi:MAG TPA: hypothetical protein VJ583_04315 [Nitrososphaeraceae archaeon]|nr:hypothetical protein [Nitrososphaeraceae archaeon]
MIIDVCDSSPSGGGLQSFEIYPIENLEIKNKIVKKLIRSRVYCRSTITFSFFCANPIRSRKYGKKAELFSIQDATITAAYAQLTACALGLISMGWSI